MKLTGWPLMRGNRTPAARRRRRGRRASGVARPRRPRGPAPAVRKAGVSYVLLKEAGVLQCAESRLDQDTQRHPETKPRDNSYRIAPDGALLLLTPMAFLPVSQTHPMEPLAPSPARAFRLARKESICGSCSRNSGSRSVWYT